MSGVDATCPHLARVSRRLPKGGGISVSISKTGKKAWGDMRCPHTEVDAKYNARVEPWQESSEPPTNGPKSHREKALQFMLESLDSVSYLQGV